MYQLRTKVLESQCDILQYLETDNGICTQLLSVVIFIGFDCEGSYATPQNYGACKFIVFSMHGQEAVTL